MFHASNLLLIGAKRSKVTFVSSKPRNRHNDETMLCSNKDLEEEFNALVGTFPDEYFCEGITDLPQLEIKDDSIDNIE